jgi:bacteriocin biosynthesis cyclodehydratase domain-containing protein
VIRPTIRPGAPLLRRDARHLQVGTSPGIVIDDQPGLRSFLRLLDGVRDVAQLRRLAAAEAPDLETDVADILGPLVACGAVVDARTLHTRRPRLRVALHDDHLGRPLARAIGHVLTGLGVPSLDAADPDLLIVVSCGEPRRSVFDRARREGIAHLLVVLDEDRVRVGPLVVPGVTPCLTCLDLNRTDWDPAWPALLPQLGRSSWTTTPPTVAAPLTYMAAAEVGVEVQALAGGSRPRTSGRVLAIGPRHDDRASWPVAFHHSCACALLPAA